MGTRKESHKPARGQKEMPSFIAPYYGSKEEMKTAFCVGNKGIYPSPSTKEGKAIQSLKLGNGTSRLEGHFLFKLQACYCFSRWEVDSIPPNALDILGQKKFLELSESWHYYPHDRDPCLCSLHYVSGNKNTRQKQRKEGEVCSDS